MNNHEKGLLYDQLQRFIDEGSFDSACDMLLHNELTLRQKVFCLQRLAYVRVEYHGGIADLLYAFQRAGLNLDTPGPRSHTTVLHKACECILSTAVHASYNYSLINNLLDAGAQVGGENLSWVQDKIAQRSTALRNMRGALASAWYCMRHRRCGVPRDVVRLILEPIARRRMGWKNWL